MFRGLIGRLGVGFADDESDETDRRFRPSTLDRSVLFAHGSGRNEVNRELRDVQEDARELEQHQR